MIKLRWEEYLGLSGWALNAITSVLMRERDSGRLVSKIQGMCFILRISRTVVGQCREWGKWLYSHIQGLTLMFLNMSQSIYLGHSSLNQCSDLTQTNILGYGYLFSYCPKSASISWKTYNTFMWMLYGLERRQSRYKPEVVEGSAEISKKSEILMYRRCWVKLT